jgi:hypothetical protein
MRLRSAAVLLAAIVVSADVGGLADSQSAGMAIQVVVTRSCSINTSAPTGLAITCSRGTPPVQTSSSFTSTLPSQPSATNESGAAVPQRTVAFSTAAGAHTVGGAADGSVVHGAGNPPPRGANTVATGTSAGDSGADLASAEPRQQEVITINF